MAQRHLCAKLGGYMLKDRCSLFYEPKRSERSTAWCFRPMLSPLDSIGEGMVFGLSVRSFVRTDLVTTISHERLEQSR